MSRYSVWDHVNPGRMRHDRNMADILLQVPLALGRTSSFLLLHPLRFPRTRSFPVTSLAAHCPGEFEHLLMGFLPIFS